MVIGMKISQSERVESANTADRRSIHLKEFAVRTRINTDWDAADASQLNFFYWLFTPEMFCCKSLANDPVCFRNDRSSTKPTLQEVNKRPCCAQQRVNVPATYKCISGTDLLRQFYRLPHWDRSCRSNFPSHPVTVYWQRANQSQDWPYNIRRLVG